MGDLAVMDLNVRYENAPKLQSETKNPCSYVECDTESDDKILVMNNESDFASKTTSFLEVSDPNCDIDNKVENDSFCDKTNPSTENVKNSDVLSVASNSSLYFKKVNKDSSVKGSQNSLLDKANHQTVPKVLQMETNVSDAKEDLMQNDDTSLKVLQIDDNDDEQYIVIDEAGSCVTETGDEDTLKKTRKSPDDSKETSPTQQNKIKPVLSIKKITNLPDDIAEDTEAIEEEIDSWLAGISSGESEKSNDDSVVTNKTLEISSEEKENRKSSDSEKINSVLKEMGLEKSIKLLDNEAILEDISIKEQEQQTLTQEVHKTTGDVSREENDEHSSTGDGSIEDGFDIESDIEAVGDDEDEICSRVDSIRKSKHEEMEEDTDMSDEEYDEEDEFSDSESIVAIVDAISEEEGDNLISKDASAKKNENMESISGHVKGSNVPLHGKTGTKETPEMIEKQVKLVLYSICNVVVLQLDQEMQSNKIAAMESVLHGSRANKNKETVLNHENSSLVNKAVLSGEHKEKQCDYSSHDETKNLLIRKRQANFVHEESHRKKQKLQDELESSEVGVKDISNELNSVSGRQLKEWPQLSSHKSPMGKPYGVSAENIEPHLTTRSVKMEEDIETKVGINNSHDVNPTSGTLELWKMRNGNCTFQELLNASSDDENIYVEVAESDVKRFIQERIQEYYMTKYADVMPHLNDRLKKMKQNLEDQKKYNATVRVKIRDLAIQQSETFQQYGYNPKIEKRTVGVNVRIVQPTNSKVATTVAATKSSPVRPSAGISSMQPAKSIPASRPVQSHVTSSTCLNNSAVSFTPAQSTGNQASTMNSNVSLPSKTISTNNLVATSASLQSLQVVDEKDISLSRYQMSLPNMHLRAATPVRGQLLGKANMPQNLIPLQMMTSLPSMVQLLPTRTTVSSAMTDINMIRMVRPSSGLPQTTRLAYFVPNTPGARPFIHQVGVPRLAVNVSPQQSAVLPNMRHPLQTFVLTPMPVISTNSQGAIGAQTRTVTSATSKSMEATTTTALTPCFNKHPAPLPPSQMYQPNPTLKALPPKPSLKASKVSTGIVLSWNMSLTTKHAGIATYQLYAYQENKGPAGHHLWKKVGDINALPLPMACTLTQFVEGYRYHFAVRAIDSHNRSGPFSEPASILLFRKCQPGEMGPNKSSR